MLAIKKFVLQGRNELHRKYQISLTFYEFTQWLIFYDEIYHECGWNWKLFGKADDSIMMLIMLLIDWDDEWNLMMRTSSTTLMMTLLLIILKWTPKILSKIYDLKSWWSELYSILSCALVFSLRVVLFWAALFSDTLKWLPKIWRVHSG